MLDRHFPARAEYVDLKDYAAALYDGDIERREDVPETIVAFGAKTAAADALIVATPEYNGGISSALENMVDWVSRLKPMPFGGKH